MLQFKVFLSLVILGAALFLLFDKFFTPQPIQITLQSGQEVTTSTAEYFSLSEVLLLIISAFLIGTTATYLFYNAEQARTKSSGSQTSESTKDAYTIILPLLKPDEKQAITSLLESSGEMQQNKLAAKLSVSKVKATRILYRLEEKGLITKERHGFTNMVKLKK